jgi:chromosome segregation protein
MYSVVGQGKLEEVLNSKAEERRALIDEAAGVLKYRKRKEKAVRKMAAIDQNIVRLKDIVREVEKQVRPLKDQADQAQIFNELSRELRDLEISLAVSELKELQECWGTETKRQTNLKNRMDELKSSLRSEEEKTKKLRSELENFGSDSSSVHGRSAQLERVLERLLGSLSLLEEKEKNFEERCKRLSQEDSNLKARLAQKEGELSQSRNELKEVIEALSTATSQLECARKGEAEVFLGLEDCGRNIEAASKSLSVLKEQLEKREKSLSESESAVGSLGNEVSLLTSRIQASKVRGEEAKLLIEYKEKFLSDVTGRMSRIVAGLKQCLVKERQGRALVGDLKCDELENVENFRRDLFLHFEKELTAVQARLEKRKEVDALVRVRLAEKSGELEGQKELFAAGAREVEELQRALKELEESLSGLWNKRERLRERIDSLKNEMGALQIKVASLDERRNSLERLIGNQRAEIRETELNRQERLHAVGKLDGIRDRVSLLEHHVHGLMRGVQRSLEELKHSARDEAVVFGDVRQMIRESEAAENRLREQGGAIQESLHQVELSKAQLELKVQTAVQKIVDEYNLPLERALEKYPLEIETGEAEKRARKLRARIAGLGPINPIAIQEYNCLEERHNLLVGQSEDLTRSRKMLFKILKEIDRKIEGTFLETFKEVNVNFQFLFSGLFPGGKGELSLTDPDNVLESGVEIEVFPDGKKAQKLSLLSGGERALVALALLFAIYLRRPSPFYILDEVEAALDDTNIQRFIGLLSEMKEHSQFLVITHQKRTMEAANSLYGVTMQADGVSRLISQKLN